MQEAYRILIVDDHALVRNTLGLSLRNQIGIEIVGECSNAEDALRFAVSHDLDIIVMDIDMPGLACFDALRRILSIKPKIKALFLSAFILDSYIEQSLAAGGKGYISKEEPLEKLVKAIRDVAAGRYYFSDAVWDRLVVTEKGIECLREGVSRLSRLTVREIEVLRYIALGYSKKEIAAIMHLAEKTIETHSFNLMSKLNIHDKVKLTRFAIQEGLAKA